MAADDLGKLLSEVGSTARTWSEQTTELSKLLKQFEVNLRAMGAHVKAHAEEDDKDLDTLLQIDLDRTTSGGLWQLYYRLGNRTGEAVKWSEQWGLLNDAPVPIKLRAARLLPSLLKRIRARLTVENRRLSPVISDLRSIVDGMKEGK